MPRFHLLLWLLVELGRFHLSSADPATVVTGYLGQAVKLPCQHPSWSPLSNSMCWGKGACPKSKCKNELVHTDGTRMLSRTSSRYSLQGPISRGNVSLTISNTRVSDSSVYCCRIEVPGWFNDIKRNIRLQLKKAQVPRTTLQPRTTTITTTKAWTSSTPLLSTTGAPTPEITTTAPPQASTWAPAAVTTCPLNTESSLPATSPTLTTELAMFPTLATEPATSLTLATELTMEPAMEGTTTYTNAESQTSVLPSGPGTATLDVSHVSHGAGASETSQGPAGVEEIQMTDHRDLLMVIVPSVGLLLFLILLVVLLRGKITENVCFQKHSRLEESKRGLNGMQRRGEDEDEDGLFTL
ncbi:T-cell immunoglobulin and mucin domain-containing protein 4 [Sorex fumeus]|uniref:T-cell immunoglobulin and mucin domain-containing protein 4 n=1 Tax=Sorex fumeus TaxID=62283 RepID=UPI0024ADBA39|nr:T-cell immunoglobulin and mucin domain-containing protein 4 [Sorex fumeus]